MILFMEKNTGANKHLYPFKVTQQELERAATGLYASGNEETAKALLDNTMGSGEVKISREGALQVIAGHLVLNDLMTSENGIRAISNNTESAVLDYPAIRQTLENLPI